MVKHYEKSRPSKPHYLTTQIQKKLIYNYCATITWVLQLVCNYPRRDIVY
jgi:hypothetical protein